MLDQSRRVREWLNQFDSAAQNTLLRSLARMQDAAAEERNRKAGGNKLEPGQLRQATPSEAAYVKATDPMVQPGAQHSEQQSSQQAAEQP